VTIPHRWYEIVVEKLFSREVSRDLISERAVVPNYGFADCYTYAGDEKYRKQLVSLRRAEYRFCSIVAVKADDGMPIFGEHCA